MTGRRYVVAGRVQGVGFRWFVARHARQLGVCGYAQNLPDGRVEVLAGGPDEALDALERRLREGPAHAAVDGVSLVEKVLEIDCSRAFDIR